MDVLRAWESLWTQTFGFVKGWFFWMDWGYDDGVVNVTDAISSALLQPVLS